MVSLIISWGMCLSRYFLTQLYAQYLFCVLIWMGSHFECIYFIQQISWWFYHISVKYNVIFPLLLFSRPVVSKSLWPHGLQHSRLLCPSPSPEVCPSSCILHWWCHPVIPSSDVLFSFCLHPFPASDTFPVSQLFSSDYQNTGVSASASVLQTSIQGWFPLRLTGLISLLSKSLLGVFSSTTVRRHQFLAVLSLQSSSHNHMWPLRRP